MDSSDNDKILFSSGEEGEQAKHGNREEHDNGKEGNKGKEVKENIMSKNRMENKEGKEGQRETKDSGKVTMAKCYPSKVEMQEVKEMTRRRKETFNLDECEGKAGGTNVFEKYLCIATVKAMELGKAEYSHFEVTNEEVAKIL